MNQQIVVEGLRVKVCGLTRMVDIELALELGASALGINLYGPSPRSIDMNSVRTLLPSIPVGQRVAVDVAPSLRRLGATKEAGFDRFQIHFDPHQSLEQVPAWAGLVGVENLWLAPRLPSGDLFPKWLLEFAATFLIDAYSAKYYGGTGKVGDWLRFRGLRDTYAQKQWILAGGLCPGNIHEAVRESGAAFVDVNSGVESAPGIKNPTLVRKFFCIAPLSG